MADKRSILGLKRQGDVIIVKVDPKQVNLGKEIVRDNGRVILAYGEVTGHSHAIADDGVVFFESIDPKDAVLGTRFLQIANAAILKHNEHDPIELDAGTYEIRIQREYIPGGIRNVAD